MKSIHSLLTQFIAVLVTVYHGFLGQVLAANTYDAAVVTHPETITRTNDVAITARHLLWKVGASANTVALCTAATNPLGTIDNIETSTGLNQTVLLLGKGGTKKMVASGVIAVGAVVYTDAAGKVAGSGTVQVGLALTASGADNDIIEVNEFTPPVTPGIPASTYDANSILYATTDDTPVALTVAASRVVGRKSTGDIVALTGTEVRAIVDPISWTAASSSGTGANLAIPITARYVARTIAGTEALTLADGAYVGQRITIRCVAQSVGSGTLTPANPLGFLTIVLAAKGQGCELEWTGVGWIITALTSLTGTTPTVTMA